ncbi:MAG: hypothetical protein EPO21_16495 [Chloroflexota bacterium]|nr:MAG: hypothetical protein EPO21_16495 [Chloroflexota bacterium]
MVKLAEDMTMDDRYQAAVRAAFGYNWGWFSMVEKSLGRPEAIKMLQELAKTFGDALSKQHLEQFGVKTMDIPMMSKVADIIHASTGFVAPWTIDSTSSGFETIEYCPRWEAAPEEYKKAGICAEWCKTSASAIYQGLSQGKAKFSMRKARPYGDPVCVFAIDL